MLAPSLQHAASSPLRFDRCYNQPKKQYVAETKRARIVGHAPPNANNATPIAVAVVAKRAVLRLSLKAVEPNDLAGDCNNVRRLAVLLAVDTVQRCARLSANGQNATRAGKKPTKAQRHASALRSQSMK